MVSRPENGEGEREISIVAKVWARLNRNRLRPGKAAAERHRDVLERVAIQACPNFCNDG